MNKEIKAFIEKRLTKNDRDFSKRVWGTKQSVYINRVKAINFIDKSHVLDAGCGFGHWTEALRKLNKKVTGIEYSDLRFDFCKKIKEFLTQENADYVKGNIESMPFEENTFDAIFSYSVIYCTDYRKSLKEFYRVLKPGGVLYFNTNGLGWYLYNLIEGHNNTENFDTRKMAIETFSNSLSYYSQGKHNQGKYIITPKQTIVNELVKLGFKNSVIGDEGTINTNNVEIPSFFKGGYYDEEGVFEVLAKK